MVVGLNHSPKIDFLTARSIDSNQLTVFFVGVSAAFDVGL